MKKELRKLVLIAIGVVIFIPAMAVAQDEIPFDFPDVDGWTKGEVVKYAREELGYGVNYESKEGGRVTLYFYDGDVPKIPDGADNKALKAQMKNAQKELKLFAEMGYYKNLKKNSDGMVMLGGDEGSVEVLHANYYFEARANKLTSDIFLFGKKNMFIKIRATRLRGDGKTPNKAFRYFLTKMDEFFSE